jgi:hypothetical protein
MADRKTVSSVAVSVPQEDINQSSVSVPGTKKRSKSEYKGSKRYIGDFRALEHRDNSDDLMLLGKGGFIKKLGRGKYVAVITCDSYKLRTSDFSDLIGGEQILPVSESGLSGMVRHLGVPAEPSHQLRLFRYVESLEKTPANRAKRAVSNSGLCRDLSVLANSNTYTLGLTTSTGCEPEEALALKREDTALVAPIAQRKKTR